VRPEASGRGQKVWRPPPIYRTDKAYWSFAAAIAHDPDPSDAIMMFLVRDVVEYSWEIRTLRRHLSQLPVFAELKMNRGLSPQGKKQNQRYFATAHGEADLFVDGLDTFEAITLAGLGRGPTHRGPQRYRALPHGLGRAAA
jgi:hypothetical protein